MSPIIRLLLACNLPTLIVAAVEKLHYQLDCNNITQTATTLETLQEDKKDTTYDVVAKHTAGISQLAQPVKNTKFKKIGYTETSDPKQHTKGFSKLTQAVTNTNFEKRGYTETSTPKQHTKGISQLAQPVKKTKLKKKGYTQTKGFSKLTQAVTNTNFEKRGYTKTSTPKQHTKGFSQIAQPVKKTKLKKKGYTQTKGFLKLTQAVASTNFEKKDNTETEGFSEVTQAVTNTISEEKDVLDALELSETVGFVDEEEFEEEELDDSKHDNSADDYYHELHVVETDMMEGHVFDEIHNKMPESDTEPFFEIVDYDKTIQLPFDYEELKVHLKDCNEIKKCKKACGNVMRKVCKKFTPKCSKLRNQFKRKCAHECFSEFSSSKNLS